MKYCILKLKTMVQIYQQAISACINPCGIHILSLVIPTCRASLAAERDETLNKSATVVPNQRYLTSCSLTTIYVSRAHTHHMHAHTPVSQLG